MQLILSAGTLNYVDVSYEKVYTGDAPFRNIDKGFIFMSVYRCHRLVIVKRAVIGSKVGWKLCTIF